MDRPAQGPSWSWTALLRRSSASERRSLVKALTYRVLIVIADFVVILLLTGQVRIAAEFAIISNIYATVLYFAHERAWAHIGWGLKRPAERN